MKRLDNAPSLDNTVLKSGHIVTKPIYVSKAVASDMFGVSKSTIYKWCQEAEEIEEWRDLSIRPSATVTLIHVETMERFLKSKNKSFL